MSVTLRVGLAIGLLEVKGMEEARLRPDWDDDKSVHGSGDSCAFLEFQRSLKTFRVITSKTHSAE